MHWSLTALGPQTNTGTRDAWQCPSFLKRERLYSQSLHSDTHICMQCSGSMDQPHLSREMWQIYGSFLAKELWVWNERWFAIQEKFLFCEWNEKWWAERWGEFLRAIPGDRKPTLQTYAWHWFSRWLRTRHFPLLGLRFLICQMIGLDWVAARSLDDPRPYVGVYEMAQLIGWASSKPATWVLLPFTHLFLSLVFTPLNIAWWKLYLSRN